MNNEKKCIQSKWVLNSRGKLKVAHSPALRYSSGQAIMEAYGTLQSEQSEINSTPAKH